MFGIILAWAIIGIFIWGVFYDQFYKASGRKLLSLAMSFSILIIIVFPSYVLISHFKETLNEEVNLQECEDINLGECEQ